jgi:hypothetical protein
VINLTRRKNEKKDEDERKKNKKNFKNEDKNEKDKKKCDNYDLKHATFKKCSAADVDCHECGKKKHCKKMCRKEKIKKNDVSDDDESDSEIILMMRRLDDDIISMIRSVESIVSEAISSETIMIRKFDSLTENET